MLSAVTSSAAFYLPQATGRKSATAEQSTAAESAQSLDKLQQTDRKVREHERAHQSAGAGLAGSAQFQYQTGPDGKKYAVAGEVPIDVSPGATPDETIRKAQQVRAAALAPADPSGQDRAVAAQAASMEQEAQLAQQNTGRDAGFALRTGGVQAYQAQALGQSDPQAMLVGQLLNLQA